MSTLPVGRGPGDGDAPGPAGEGHRGELLLVFARFPEPGRVKTRLEPALGPHGAAALHRSMAERTLRRLEGFRVQVRFDGADADRVREWLGPARALRAQGPGDLGARLRRGFAEGFAEGADPVLAVGTDCPRLGPAEVRAALAALESKDAVFGPATDGGYYLVALRRRAWSRAASLFDAVPWGGAEVLRASLAAARSAGLATRLLPALADVDRPGDLAELETELDREGTLETVSVVVPALEEQDRVGALVETLRRSPSVEVVVADGGSRDRTAAAASEAGARVVAAPRGRARQMNAGAAAAGGGLLLFLHADTTPPGAWAAAVRSVLAWEGTAGGAFGFATDSPRAALRRIEFLANWRARRFGLVYGDQGLFVARALFERVGGFPDQPLMEDYEMVRRLRRHGALRLLPAAAVSSARRWHAHGPWRTSALNLLIASGYLAGLPPGRLERWYR